MVYLVLSFRSAPGTNTFKGFFTLDKFLDYDTFEHIVIKKCNKCREKARTSSHKRSKTEDNLQFECCSIKINISTYFYFSLLFFVLE